MGLFAWSCPRREGILERQLCAMNYDLKRLSFIPWDEGGAFFLVAGRQNGGASQGIVGQRHHRTVGAAPGVGDCRELAPAAAHATLPGGGGEEDSAPGGGIDVLLRPLAPVCPLIPKEL
jgi:hypothetical protein